MQPFDFFALALATFYAAYAVSNTHGPFKVFVWLREHLPLGGLTGCIVCLSPWMAALFYAVLLTPVAPLVYIIAAGGLSLFAYRWTGGANV